MTKPDQSQKSESALQAGEDGTIQVTMGAQDGPINPLWRTPRRGTPRLLHTLGLRSSAYAIHLPVYILPRSS